MDPTEWEGEDVSENEDRESHAPVGGRDSLILVMQLTQCSLKTNRQDLTFE